MIDTKALAQATALIVQEAVDKATTPLLARLAVLEARDAAPDEASVRRMIEDAIAGLSAPRDGTDVTIADIEPLVAIAVARAVGDLPPAKDGVSITLDDVRPLIAQEAERAVAALPTPADGRSITAADVEPLVASAVERAVAALPVAKDGVGLAGAMIDRTGALVVTLSDGKICPLGRVDGKDGDPGLGFDDMSIEQTGERQATLKFVRGEQVKTFDLTVPAVIDRGVFKEGQAYMLGDAVTFGGSLWIAQKDTTDKPDGPDTGWRLAVKKGRDGRDLSRG